MGCRHVVSLALAQASLTCLFPRRGAFLCRDESASLCWHWHKSGAGSARHRPSSYIEFYTMGVQQIKSYDEFKQVTGTDKIVVIDFWATWCGPCKMIGPIFEKIAETPAGEKLGFYKVDVDEQSQIASEVGIRAMPTFAFFKNGEKIETVVGADPSKLQAAISKFAGV